MPWLVRAALAGLAFALAIFGDRLIVRNIRDFDDVREIDALNERPEFYTTETTNCTTDVYRHAKADSGDPRFSRKILLSGYAAEYVDENGLLDPHLPFPDLCRISRVDAADRAADRAPDFSARIRRGLPRPGPSGSPPGIRPGVDRSAGAAMTTRRRPPVPIRNPIAGAVARPRRRAIPNPRKLRR